MTRNVFISYDEHFVFFSSFNRKYLKLIHGYIGFAIKPFKYTHTKPLNILLIDYAVA